MTRLIYSRNWPRIAQLLVVAILAVYIGAVLGTAAFLDDIDDPFIRYTAAFLIVQFSFLGLLAGLLVVGKYLRVKWESRQASRTRKLEELLSASQSDEIVLKAARRWPEEFLTVVYSALQSIRGSERRRIVRLLEASALYPKLLLETSSRNPDRAIRAIGLLAQLDTPDAHAAIRRALGHPAETIKQAARKAIMQGKDYEAQRQLLDSFPQLPAWQRLLMLHFAPADEMMLPRFIDEALHSGDETRIVIALEMVLTRQRLLSSPIPFELAQSANPEIRIKFYKALRFLRLEADVTKMLQIGLADADWRVRAMAAQACGQFRAASLAERLLEMCRTFENPAEAANAARALAALGGEGWLRLQEVANSQTEVARKIATEAVERHMLGGAA